MIKRLGLIFALCLLAGQAKAAISVTFNSVTLSSAYRCSPHRLQVVISI